MSARPILGTSLLRAASIGVVLAFGLAPFAAGDDAPKKTLGWHWTLDVALDQLSHQPDDVYLQYVAMQIGKREGRETEALRRIDELTNPVNPLEGRGRRNQADLFSTFTGALAIQESLQLDTMRGQMPWPGEPAPNVGSIPPPIGEIPPAAKPTRPAAPPLPDKVAVDKIAGPANRSHPWKEMLGDKKSAPDLIANFVPHGFWFAEFPSVARLHDITEMSKLWGGHFFTQVLGDACSQQTLERIKKQLGLLQLPPKALEAMQIDGIAATGSDLFFAEGTDITLLVRSRKLAGVVQLFEGALESLGKTESGEYGGFKYTHRRSPDGSLNVYAATPQADLLVRSNSLPAFKRVLDAFLGRTPDGNAAPRLGESDEFRYVQTLMPRRGDNEAGFVYLSDPFIRHMVGPQLKLTERRRVLVYNHLRMIGHAALLFRTEFGRAPKSLEELAETKCAPGVFGKGELAHPDGGSYSLSEDGMSGVCSIFGRAESLAPCIEHPVAEVTGREARDYESFLRSYREYWRTYFDPIAMRVQATPKQYRLETLILPLIDNSIYTDLAGALGGEPVTLSPLPTPKHQIGGVWVHFEKKQLLDALGPETTAKKESGDSRKEMTAVNDMRRLGLAIANYEATYGWLPGNAIRSADGKPLLSWRVAILPYIEQQNLYVQFHLDEPWDSEHNKKLIAKMPPIFSSGNDKLSAQKKTVYLAPVGKNTIFEPDGQKVRIADITDGTSNTIMLVRAADQAAIWTKPDDLNFDPDKPLAGLERPGMNYFLALMGDGSTKLISNNLPAKSLAAAFTRNDGIPVDLDQKERVVDTGPKNRARIVMDLKMIGLAMHNFASANSDLPTQATVAADGKPRLSWRVAILPFLDEVQLYRQFHLDEPWDSEHNKRLIAKMPRIFAGNNKKLNDEGKTPYVVPLSEPGMYETLFNTKQDRHSLEQLTAADGAADTIMGTVVDDEHAVIWTKPDDLMVDLQHPVNGLLRLDGDDPIVLLADGAVRQFNPFMDPKTIAAMFTWKASDTVNAPPGDVREPPHNSLRFLPSKSDLEQLEMAGLDLNKVRRLLKDGIGDEIGFQMHDASKLLDFDTGGAIGPNISLGQNSSLLFGIGPAVQFLTGPSSVSIPVKNAAVVDAFLDEYDRFLTTAKPAGAVSLVRFTEFYKFPVAKAHTVRCMAIKFAGLKLRFFWGRIGDGLYFTNRPFLLDDIASAQAEGKPRQPASERSHALLQIHPENFHDVLPGYLLGWEENQRSACQKNLSMIANVARGWGDPDAGGRIVTETLLNHVQRVYGVRPFCPDGGAYDLSAMAFGCRCNIHGHALDPRQLSAPADSSPAGRAFHSLAGFHATLTFTKDGLRAIATLDRKE
jgi:hypothetical protein